MAKDLIQLALKVGLAVGEIYDSVVDGSDTRTSACALKHDLISGVLFGGGSCSDAGVLSTPTLALAARHQCRWVLRRQVPHPATRLVLHHQA